ncbi:hemicentin-2-like [Saccoglossus kowalevskii]
MCMRFTHVYCQLVWLIISTVLYRGAWSYEFTETPIDTLVCTSRTTQMNCSFDGLSLLDRTRVQWLQYKEDMNGATDVSIGRYTFHDSFTIVGDENEDEYHLRIENSTLEFEAEYECKVIGYEASDFAMLYVLEHGPVCAVISNIVVENEDVVFNCTIDKAVPPGELLWLQDGDVMSRENDSLVHIWITSFHRSNNGSVVNCQLDHVTLPPPDVTCDEDIIMIVQYPPVVKIWSESMDTVIEGDSYEAECRVAVYGFPEDIKHLFWKGPGGEIYDGSTLYLHNVSRNDEGNYTCVAMNEYHDGRNGTGTAYVELDVQFSPTVKIVDESDGNVIENEAYLARCTSYANPDPTYTWVDPLENKIEVENDQVLVVSNITRSQNGSYTCEAENIFWDNSTGYGESFVYVNVQFEPALLSTFSGAVTNDGTCKAGESFSVQCLVVYANPNEVDLIWLNSTTHQVGEDLLIFNPVKKEHTGKYICHGNNTFWDGTNGRNISDVLIDVQYSPEVDLSDDTVTFVVEGSDYHATCNVDANPDADVYWRHPDNDITAGSELHLYDVKRDEHGNYTCHANNTFWDGSTGEGSVSLDLDVQYPPTVALSSPLVRKESENVTLKCVVTDGNPTEADLRWLHNGETVHDDGVLDLHDITREDHGEYNCTASNTYYDASRGFGSGITYINVQYDPIVTVLGEVRCKVDEDVTLKCQGDSNPPPTVVTWSIDGQIVANDTSFTINDVKKDDAGSYLCTAYTVFYDDSLGSDEDVTQLVVEYASEVHINVHNHAVILDDNLAITCSATEGIPDPYRIELYIIGSGDEETIVAETDVDVELLYQVQSVTMADNGTYYCVAYTEYYDTSEEKTYSDKEDVFIIYAPIITGENSYTVEEESAAHISCVINAHPVVKETDIKWEYESGQVIPDTYINIPDPIGTVVTSTLTIDSATEDHGGIYTCYAWNDVGTSSYNINLTVNLPDSNRMENLLREFGQLSTLGGANQDIADENDNPVTNKSDDEKLKNSDVSKESDNDSNTKILDSKTAEDKMEDLDSDISSNDGNPNDMKGISSKHKKSVRFGEEC